MPATALILVLGAAFLHATWNLVLARAPDTHAAIAVAVVVGAVALLPLALLHWHIAPEAVPFLAASCATELLYFALLARAYGRAELSLVYPIARGSAPAFVLIGGWLVLAIPITIVQVGGVLLVATGVLLVRGLTAPAAMRDVGLALVVGFVISTYTLLDRQGVAHADPIAYGFVILLVPGVVYVAAIIGRSGIARLRRAVNGSVVYGGLAAGFTYTAILIALTMAPPGPVAAVRETSVVMATALAVVVLKERVPSSRWLGSVVLVAGVCLVVFGGP